MGAIHWLHRSWQAMETFTERRKLGAPMTQVPFSRWIRQAQSRLFTLLLERQMAARRWPRWSRAATEISMERRVWAALRTMAQTRRVMAQFLKSLPTVR